MLRREKNEEEVKVLMNLVHEELHEDPIQCCLNIIIRTINPNIHKP